MAPPRPSFTPPPIARVAITEAAAPKPPAIAPHAAGATAPAVTPKPAAVAPHAAVATTAAVTPKPAAVAPPVDKHGHDSDQHADPGAGIAKLRMELDEAARSAAAREADLRTTLSQRDARIRELEAAATEQGARNEKAETSVRDQISARDARIKELESLLSARDQRIEKLEQGNKALLASQGEPGDDLKMIRGIGPAFERELRRLGVVTFAQIAAWTPEDIDAIGPKIKAKPERIRRENWIESATELAKHSSTPTT